MGLVETVSAQMKEAMKARDKERTKTLRSVRAAFIEAMKRDNSDSLPDETAMAILRKLGKQRAESITAYKEGGRDDLAEAEEAELAVISSFLPKLADEAQTTAWVEQAIKQTGAAGPSDMGKVMGILMKNHKAELDGKLTNVIVRRLLTA